MSTCRRHAKKTAMIHFAIGTKAQFIKMAPIMHLLEQAREPYHLLDLSQHASITGRILDDFALRPAVTRLAVSGKSVETYWQAAHWLAHGFGQVFFRRSQVRHRWFAGTDGVVLIHGDTLSTLMGLYLARGAGLPSGQVEAGLTSGNRFDPFPEESIRRHVEQRADYLFAPDDVATLRLQRIFPARRVINTQYNTGRDAMQLVLNNDKYATRSPHGPPAKYGVVTLHRLETLSSSRRLRRAVNHILALADVLGTMRFYVHPPTKNALKRHRLYDAILRSRSIELHDLAPYPEFVGALASATCVLTDGGSIQEEAAYMEKPCLVLRHRTERSDGLDRNAILSTWDIGQDLAHLERVAQTRTNKSFAGDLTAARTILETVGEFRVRHASR